MGVVLSSVLLKHYKRDDVQQAIIDNSFNREIAVKYGDDFGKRPDTLQYGSDIIEAVKNGATSFHASEELWSNPLQLSPNLGRKDLDDLRIGWDLVLDIDCKYFEYSKFTAHLAVEALKYHGIKSIFCKYSGNNGFHIAVPFESFPKNVIGKETRLLFPESPKRIALYLGDFIKDKLSAMILETNVNKIIKDLGLDIKRVIKNGRLDPFEILHIDTILISSRHLFRMPYCFNEKSWLVSIPVEAKRILEFRKEDAKPENIEVKPYIIRKQNEDEGKRLIVQAFDYNPVISKEDKVKIKVYNELNEYKTKIPAELFPPCLKNILKAGMSDGRKRALFILLNFLKSVNWSYGEAEALVREWNAKNNDPLRDTYVNNQLKYFKLNKALPPNCLRLEYYVDIGICQPDNLCGGQAKTIKNPVNYAKKRGYYMQRDKENK